MPPFSTLRRSSPSIQQFLIRQSSTASSSFSPSQIDAKKYDRKQHLNTVSGSSLIWVSAILVGSSLGLPSLFSISDSDSDFDFDFSLLESSLSFTDWSAESSEIVVGDGRRSSRSLFRKLSLREINDSFLFGDAYRRKIFFNSQKRIRQRSPPEKVFEYFASCRTSEGELLMKPADLMRAVVHVFPTSESHLVRDGYLRGERNPGHLLYGNLSSDEFVRVLYKRERDIVILWKQESLVSCLAAGTAQTTCHLHGCFPDFSCVCK